jgi:predicted Zn-dependent peptidase
MLSLAFSEKSLEVQKNVVCEEFKQRYLNQPYGDVWLKMRPLAYEKHPYQWATIGKNLAQIEEAKMEDVKAFFNTFYVPSNAILVVAGAVKTAEVKKLVDQWFGSIPSGIKPIRNLPQEPAQLQEKRQIVEAKVPLNALYMAFHMPARQDVGYYAADLLSDILSRGNSSRLYCSLLKEQQLFSDINAYHLGSIDPGLFVVEGKPAPGVSMEKAEASIWQELDRLKNELVGEDELAKVKNKMESTMEFAEMSLLDKAMNLAYFELLGNAEDLNHETEKYLAVSAQKIQEQAQQIFRKENSSTLSYLAKN